jgi:CheY-like chemotaxis protein
MVLVVDDDREWRETVGEFLGVKGYTIQSAANGSEALEFSKHYQTPPELILLDLNMPILDGWGFLAERRFHPQLAEVPVVIMSAARGVDGRAKEAGAAMVMRKPIVPEALLQVIERYAATA